jgi:hypothetical protein
VAALPAFNVSPLLSANATKSDTRITFTFTAMSIPAGASLVGLRDGTEVSASFTATTVIFSNQAADAGRSYFFALQVKGLSPSSYGETSYNGGAAYVSVLPAFSLPALQFANSTTTSISLTVPYFSRPWLSTIIARRNGTVDALIYTVGDQYTVTFDNLTQNTSYEFNIYMYNVDTSQYSSSTYNGPSTRHSTRMYKIYPQDASSLTFFQTTVNIAGNTFLYSSTQTSQSFVLENNVVVKWLICGGGGRGGGSGGSGGGGGGSMSNLFYGLKAGTYQITIGSGEQTAVTTSTRPTTGETRITFVTTANVQQTYVAQGGWSWLEGDVFLNGALQSGTRGGRGQLPGGSAGSGISGGVWFPTNLASGASVFYGGGGTLNDKSYTVGGGGGSINNQDGAWGILIILIPIRDA